MNNVYFTQHLFPLQTTASALLPKLLVSGQHVEFADRPTATQVASAHFKCFKSPSAHHGVHREIKETTNLLNKQQLPRCSLYMSISIYVPQLNIPGSVNFEEVGLWSGIVLNRELRTWSVSKTIWVVFSTGKARVTALFDSVYFSCWVTWNTHWLCYAWLLLCVHSLILLTVNNS